MKGACPFISSKKTSWDRANQIYYTRIKILVTVHGLSVQIFPVIINLSQIMTAYNLFVMRIEERTIRII